MNRYKISSKLNYLLKRVLRKTEKQSGELHELLNIAKDVGQQFLASEVERERLSENSKLQQTVEKRGSNFFNEHRYVLDYLYMYIQMKIKTFNIHTIKNKIL